MIIYFLGGASDASKQKGSAPGSLFSSTNTTATTAFKKPEGGLFGSANSLSGGLAQQTASTEKKESLFNKPTTSANNTATTEVKSSLDLNVGSNKPNIFNKVISTDASNAQKKDNVPGDIFSKTTSSVTQEKPKEPGNIFAKNEAPKQDSQTKPTAQPNIFGQNKPTETGSTQPQTQQASIFGGSKTSSVPSTQTTQSEQQKSSDSKTTQPQAQPQASIFGQKTTPINVTQSQTQTSLIGQKPSQSTSGLGQPLTQTKPATEGALGKPLTQGQSGSTLFPKPAETDSKPKETSLMGSQINTGLQNKGALGDQANKPGFSSGGMFGTQPKLGEVKKPEGTGLGMSMGMGIGTGSSLGSGSAGQDVTIEGLLKTWKEDLDKQVQTFAEVNKSLEQHEVEAYKNIDMGEKLLKNLQEMEKEYRAIELACDGIDKGQGNLLYKLNSVEQELSNYLYKDENNKPLSQGKMSRTDLINQAKSLNTEISKIEMEMTKLINEMSQSVGDKEHDHLSENLLDSYFDALQFVESETLKSITKLNKIESELVSQ